MKEGSILIVDDNKRIISALEILLAQYFQNIITLNSPNGIDKALRENPIDVILLDMNFTASVNTGNEGLYWLDQIKQRNADVQVVVFTAYADINLAVDAIKKGATDFVVKPWDNDKLVATLQNAYNLRKSKREMKHLKELKQELIRDSQMYWGTSAPMLRLHSTVQKVAVTDANILITGENGTGKEMLAREIHNQSGRRNELMVGVDMGAIAETLFESELFGHVKGAFTDAVADRAGKFEVANGGTLFLDEIGNLPLHLQAKLLTVIQSNSIVRVGSNVQQPVNIRLICATNRNLEQMVADGSFREDLLYRINTIHLEIPPLRERPEDILPLSEMFLKSYAAKYNKTITGFDERARKEMIAYPWQGNIRELQHTIEKSVIMSDKSTISADSLLLRPAAPTKKKEQAVATLEEMEKNMIQASINRNSGNMSAVAEQLGITRQTLYNKIKKYGIG